MRVWCIQLILSLIASDGLAGSNSVITKYLDFGDNGQARLLAADRSGNLFAAGLVTESSGLRQIRVIKTNSNGNPLASFDFGGSDVDTIAAAATDAQGNIVIVGSTASSDFPVVASVTPQSRLPAGFVVKIDSQLQHILLSTLLGGTNGRYASVGAVALGATGDIYVAGTTDEVDFPLSGNALQTAVPADPLGVSEYGFVTQLTPKGQIVFSTYYSGSNCQNSSGCMGNGTTVPTAIGIDSTGNVIVAGNTNTVDLPTTDGAYSRECNCAAGFIASFASGGSKLIWATLLPASQAVSSIVSITSLAVEGDGSVVVAGSVNGMLPATVGAVQSEPQIPGAASGFVTRVDSTGSRLVFSTYLGGALVSAGVGGVRSVAVDAQGLIWVTGSSAPPNFFGVFSLGTPYTASLSSDGTRFISAFAAPNGASGQAIIVRAQSGPATLGPSGSLLLGGATQAPSILGIGNSAGQQVSGVIAPLTVVSLYGVGIGPPMPLSAQVLTIGPGNQRAVSTSLGGIQVMFNGIAAPLLYAGPTQINAVVPIEAANDELTTIEIVTATGTIMGPTLRVRPSDPQVFGTSPYSNFYYAAALNQDGTINSQANPAPNGSVVTIWAAGAGLFNSSFADGTIVGPKDPSYLDSYDQLEITLPVSVLSYTSGNFLGSDLTSLRILYAGAAPNAIEGMIQINFQLPSTSSLQYVLQIGAALSNAFVVYQK